MRSRPCASTGCSCLQPHTTGATPSVVSWRARAGLVHPANLDWRVDDQPVCGESFVRGQHIWGTRRAPSTRSGSRDGYYIYGLLDPRAYHETSDELLSIFYVGKGKGSRWKQHETDVRQDLERTEQRLERDHSKAQRIRRILDSGQEISAVRLSAGYVDEKDAYAAESLAIDTIGALLRHANRPGLTNATPGHHAGFVLLRDHFVFTRTLPYELDSAANAEDSNPNGILVKGTVKDMSMPQERLVDSSMLPAAVAGHAAHIRVIELRHDDDHAPTRRGWNPLDPWTDEEARQRARRYWPIAAHRVADWLTDPSTMPTQLLLAIPAAHQQTVVRYAWEVDHTRTWEYYPDSNRWGIPLGRRDHEHPMLGRSIREDRDGRDVQVLYNYSSGIRILHC